MTSKEITQAFDDRKFKEYLESNDTQKVHQALVNFRKIHSHCSKKLAKVRELDIIKHCVQSLGHPKLCNVSLSILANCCVESSLREEVIKTSAVPDLVRILKGLANDEIINRACRCLANIALSDAGLILVHKYAPVSHIVKFLNEAEDPNFHETAVRTLRVLCNDVLYRKLLLQEDGFVSIAKLLASDSQNVVKCAVKALASLTSHCNASVALQLKQGNMLPKLVEMYGNADVNSRHNIITCFENLACLDAMRIELKDSDALRILMKDAIGSSLTSKRRSPILALCMCSTIYWRMDIMEKLDLIFLLMDVLNDKCLQTIFKHVLSAIFVLVTEIKDLRMIERCLISHLMDRLTDFTMSNNGHVEKSTTTETKLEQESSAEIDSTSKLEPFPSTSTEIESKKKYTIYIVNSIRDTEKKYNNAKSPKVVEENTGKKVTVHTEFVCATSNEVKSNDWNVDPMVQIDDKSEIKKSEDSKFKILSGPVYSIHSPTYQGLQYSETHNFASGSAYSSYASPSSSCSTMPARSPDYYSFEGNVNSPLSCSSLVGPWSPSSSTGEKNDMCWSPVVSSGSQDTSSGDSTVENEDQLPESVILNEVEAGCSNLLSETFPSLPCDSLSSSDEYETQLSFKKHKRVFKRLKEIRNRKIVAALRTTQKQEHSSVTQMSVKSDTETEDESSQCDGAKCIKDKSTLDISRKHKSLTSFIRISEGDGPTDPKLMKFAPSTSSTVENQSTHEVGCTASYKDSTSEPKRALDHYIFILLSHLERQLKSNENSPLVEESTVRVMLDYLYSVPNPSPRCMKILSSLVANRPSFSKFIVSDVVGLIDRELRAAHSPKDCSKCSDIEDWREELLLAAMGTAESEYGIGTLKHILYRGKPRSKLNCIYAISRLIRQKAKLKILFNIHIGLNSLFDFLRSKNQQEFRSSALSLSSVCRSLCPKFSRPRMMITWEEHCVYKLSEFDLHLLLDDGSTVETARSVLSVSSDYFASLLEGFYVEAKQNRIVIPDASRNGMVHLLHLIHGCDRSCPVIKSCPFDLLHELLKLSERFLLDSIKQIISKFILMYVDASSAKRAYCNARDNNSHDLAKTLLQFILCDDEHKENDYLQCLQDLIDEDAEDILESVKKILSA